MDQKVCSWRPLSFVYELDSIKMLSSSYWFMLFSCSSFFSILLCFSSLLLSDDYLAFFRDPSIEFLRLIGSCGYGALARPIFCSSFWEAGVLFVLRAYAFIFAFKEFWYDLSLTSPFDISESRRPRGWSNFKSLSCDVPSLIYTDLCISSSWGIMLNMIPGVCWGIGASIVSVSRFASDIKTILIL